MNTTPTTRSHALAAAAVAAVALTAAACGSSSKSATQTTTPPTTAAPAAARATGAPFGSDCGMIPANGTGSLHSMGMETVLQAAAANPLLTTFAADAKTAGLASELNSMHAFTVFAPANDAFTKLPASETTMMMHSSAELAKILKYHVVDRRVTPAEIAAGRAIPSLEGDTLTPSKMGAVYEVNNASIICGNIQTENATVYIINKVLTPMH